MSQGEQHPTQPAQQSEVVPVTPLPAIGDDQWNKDIADFLTSNANNAIAELGFSPNVLHALKTAGNDVARLKAEKKILENNSRDLSAHLALANNRIDFAKHDTHAMWKEVIYYREKYHILQKQYQEVLRAHSICATGPPEQPYIHLLQELEKLQDMYRHTLGQNTTLKFEVQRLMQHCVNAGLIPPPQNYNVTPIPALQPPALQPTAARRVSEPAVVSHQQQTQVPARYTQGAQTGQAVRRFVSPPSGPRAPTLPVANNPTIIAGPAQSYNYHRSQFPQPQPAATQSMPPPQQRPQQAFPQQGQPSVHQQQVPAIRPRPATDLTSSDDERVPKRPRMASDPNVHMQHSAGLASHLQHQVHAQMPARAAYQTAQHRRPQPRPQVVPMDYTQDQPMQQYYSQRSVTSPTNLYQHDPPPTSPTYTGPYGANSLPNVPGPPTSVPPVMGVYGVVMDEENVTQTWGQLPGANGRMQGIGQPQRAHTDPAHPANVTFQTASTADAGTNMVTTAKPAETPAERSTGTPLESTPAAPPPDSVPVSPQVVTNGQTQGGVLSLPLTDEQAKRMRSELADSMFTEPGEDDERQMRICLFCDRRRELGLLTVPLQPLFKPTTEEMYSHLQAQHPESLEIEERDWKMELFGVGPLKNQQQ